MEWGVKTCQVTNSIIMSFDIIALESMTFCYLYKPIFTLKNAVSLIINDLCIKKNFTSLSAFLKLFGVGAICLK